jgi:hypothetical protein
MKAGDRLAIHYRDSNGILCCGPTEGMIWSRLATTGAPPMLDEHRGRILDGDFQRWIVVQDDGHVMATWVHEDHLTFTAGPDTTGIDVKTINRVINGPESIRAEINAPVWAEGPPEIQALYHLLEAAKLFKAIPWPGDARDVIHLAKRIAGYTHGADQWSQDVQSWADSLGGEGST